MTNTELKAKHTAGARTMREAATRKEFVRGTGYTQAKVIADIKEPLTAKFVGYIPTKGEWILATCFNDNGYGWTHYFYNRLALVNELIERNLPETAEAVLNYEV